MMSSERGPFELLIPWLLTIATITVGWLEFSSQQSQSNRTEFLKKQLELGFEAVAAASMLASSRDRDDWLKARKDFEGLYWGELAVVETKEVETSMVYFRTKLISEGGMLSARSDDLCDASLSLAKSVRNMVRDSWNVDLQVLDKRSNLKTGDNTPVPALPCSPGSIAAMLHGAGATLGPR
jgi:hypothetical protein